MKRYPKVHHLTEEESDIVHPDVEGIFTSGTLYLVEKLDGGNFRFLLYDSRLDHEYSDEVAECDPSDGDLVFASKNVVRGPSSIDPEEVEGNFWRAINCLNTDVDRDALREAHDEYGALTLYAENMVRHSLDYDWSRVPPLIGFDIYQHTTGEFLSLPEAKDVFEDIGLSFAPVVEGPVPADELSHTDIEVPNSEYRDGEAEGVIVRNEDRGERAKYVSEQFREKLYTRWGTPKSRAEDDTELLVATYCTNARIRKQVLKMVNDRGRDLSMELMEDLYPTVVNDIWEEHWHEIIHENWTVEMDRVWQLVADRCREVLQTMVTNHDLSGAPPEQLWFMEERHEES